VTDETGDPQTSDPETPTAVGSSVLTGKESPPSPPADAESRLLVEEAPIHHPPHPEAGEHGAHPTDQQYMLIALILAAITALEVGISYIKGLGDAANPLLLILAAVKFVMVVGFFMHLRFDNRVLRRIFITGFVLAIIVYFIVFFTLGVFTTAHGIHP
jgi:cytochrome c oxidase subunit 4